MDAAQLERKSQQTLTTLTGYEREHSAVGFRRNFRRKLLSGHSTQQYDIAAARIARRTLKGKRQIGQVECWLRKNCCHK
jgi:hypothetical protein